MIRNVQCHVFMRIFIRFVIFTKYQEIINLYGNSFWFDFIEIYACSLQVPILAPLIAAGAIWFPPRVLRDNRQSLFRGRKMMNEVARRNDFAVIVAEFWAGVQRPGAGLRDHDTDTVTLSMALDCRNVR